MKTLRRSQQIQEVYGDRQSDADDDVSSIHSSVSDSDFDPAEQCEEEDASDDEMQEVKDEYNIHWTEAKKDAHGK